MQLLQDIIQQPFFWVAVFFLLTQIAVYLLLFRRLAAYKKPGYVDSGYQPVSVIIAAKNEEKNLRENLPVFLSQQYPDYEVVVINDQSEDESSFLLEDMSRQYPNLKVVTIKEHVKDFAGKKLALTLGIKAAKHDILLLSDADCRPLSDQWLKTMVEPYAANGNEIILGYSPYKKKGGLLNLFIRFDTFYTALQYMSLTLAGMPYMGVGRNLSYRKEVFFRNKGFAPYLKIASGDDDLFVNGSATPTNTTIEIHEDSFVETNPKEEWSDWMHQKRRHMRAGRLYKSNHKRVLGMLWLNNVLFYAAIIAGLFLIKPFWVPLVILGIRMLVQLIMYYMSMKKLKEADLLAFSPILDAVYQLVLLPFISLLSLRKPKRIKW